MPIALLLSHVPFSGCPWKSVDGEDSLAHFAHFPNGFLQLFIASNLSLLLQFSQALGNKMRGWCSLIALVELGLPNPSPPGSVAHTDAIMELVRANRLFPTFTLGTSGCLLLTLPPVHMNRLGKSPL